MFENTFGYDGRIPEDIREIVMWLCQDVASLQSKWDFYTVLFAEQPNAELVDEFARWSFNIIEETLRNDMTMAIGRLCDPSRTAGKANLSFATLIEKRPDVDGLAALFAEFQSACEPIALHRNKKVAHSDLNRRIVPREYALPGIGRNQIDGLLKLAEGMLNAVHGHFTRGELAFRIVAPGSAEDLIFWLRAGKQHHARPRD